MSEPTLDGDSETYPNVLHLGCGEDYRNGALNVDINPDSEADRIYDISKTPWPWPDGSFKRIEAKHLVEHLESPTEFFREAGRVLRQSGTLEITVPLGVNARTDGDHEPPMWTYERPEQYSRTHRRAWDPQVPFRLIERDLNVWLGGPLSKLTPAFQCAAQYWPAWAAERCFGGELKAVFRRCSP